MVDRDMQAQLKGWSLTTAEIMYRMPDYRDLLQTFIWQNYDVAPRFPRLIGFLNFWARNLDGPLHTVRVMHGAWCAQPRCGSSARNGGCTEARVSANRTRPPGAVPSASDRAHRRARERE